MCPAVLTKYLVFVCNMNVFMTMLKNFDGKFGQIEEQLAAINLSRRTRLTRGEQSAALWHHHKPTVQDVAQVTTESTRIESLWLNLSLLMLRLTGLQSSRLHNYSACNRFSVLSAPSAVDDDSNEIDAHPFSTVLCHNGLGRNDKQALRMRRLVMHSSNLCYSNDQHWYINWKYC